MQLTQERERYLTVEEVAEQLKYHPETVREMLRNHLLPGRKVGREWRVSQLALDEFIRGVEKEEDKPEEK